jgi:hypothetical protein
MSAYLNATASKSVQKKASGVGRQLQKANGVLGIRITASALLRVSLAPSIR